MESGSHRCVLILGRRPSGSSFSPQDREHLLLQVDREDRAVLPDPFRKLAGEETRPAAEVEHPVAGLHVPLREPFGTVQEPAEAGVEVACLFRREDLVVVGIFSGCQWNSCRMIGVLPG